MGIRERARAGFFLASLLSFSSLFRAWARARARSRKYYPYFKFLLPTEPIYSIYKKNLPQGQMYGELRSE